MGGAGAGLTGDSGSLCPRIVSRVPLTSGDWEVVNRQVWWDESHQVVYFHALKDSCLEKHLYCVSVNRPGEVDNIFTSICSLSTLSDLKQLYLKHFHRTYGA